MCELSLRSIEKRQSLRENLTIPTTAQEYNSVRGHWRSPKKHLSIVKHLLHHLFPYSLFRIITCNSRAYGYHSKIYGA